MWKILIFGAAAAFAFLSHAAADAPRPRPSFPFRSVPFADGHYLVTTHPDFTTTVIVPDEIADLAFDSTFEADFEVLRSANRKIVSFVPRRFGVRRSLVIFSAKGLIPLTLAASSIAETTYVARLIPPTDLSLIEP
ncbi:MAG: hypothetical protein JSR82_10160 [Verrucomicrobia bacterium]|nr:hypothetical protein [Verrucomicrobiota bacterium]